jgi:SAM-dependent methyltransferase
MNVGVQQQIDWGDWLRRWDAQQEGYVPEREARFTAMFDALAELLPASFVALDLACGPGSIGQRLLARFPDAQAIAVDIDPVILAIGRGALGTVAGRLRWIEADLASPDWVEGLGETELDAVLSTTALHWLEPEPLRRVYHDLARLLRPGGLFLNGDHMSYGAALPTFARLSQQALAVDRRHLRRARHRDGGAVVGCVDLGARIRTAADPAGRALRGKTRQESPPGFDVHVEALRKAGFRDVETIWQVLSSRVLLAVR